jgi:RNA polymerase sigma factor (sigma-70 family)
MDVLISPISAARDEGEFESMYEANFEFLVGVAIRKFRVPDYEAETLAHEVFLTYLKKTTGEIRDLHSWLVGAICHASRYYWRSRGRNIGEREDESLERIDPATMHIVDTLPDQLAAREALERLPPRYQEILRLRYFEGMSIIELADHLGVTPKYAQKLVTKCLRRAEQRFTDQGTKR